MMLILKGICIFITYFCIKFIIKSVIASGKLLLNHVSVRLSNLLQFHVVQFQYLSHRAHQSVAVVATSLTESPKKMKKKVKEVDCDEENEKKRL